ncbi:MAG: ATP phosphoribosyltransferase regulatory subunit [Rhodospirillaceae bacterium]|nr:ATP phosphoribosyltransferase regulatory subunit [Rhodospirillaceae bacterium]
MNNLANKALLPDGLRDGLPPDAAHEAGVVARLIASFESYGYERVTPPLVEFEDTLLDGAAQSIANDTFRLMDPVSQRMMGVRADMTLQIARIATTRLRNEARPLRLAYAGPVLRVKGSQLRPEREVFQAGVELIGASSPAADAEIIALAATALENLGVSGLSVDINLPTMVPAICAAMNLDDEVTRDLRDALDKKDSNAVEAIGGPAGALLKALLNAAGPADTAFAAMETLDLPEGPAGERTRLGEALAFLRQATPDLAVTVDPVEHRGFEYHSGLSFTVFANGVRGEIGRGGRYLAGATGEKSTGFTLFLDTILRALPNASRLQRVYLPFGVPAAQADSIRAEGWVALAGLAPEPDPMVAAREQGCTHVYLDEIIAVTRTNSKANEE